MRLFRRKKREPKPQVPKVWITINGMPFYIPVTDPYVELAYGRETAAELRRQLLS
jgi:hypothetical protein